MEKLTNTVEVRRNNRNRIFRFIYKAPKPVTKQEIANALGLSLPTISQNLSELMEEGRIEYCGTNNSTGGRKPRAIRAVSDARIAIGVSVTADCISIAAVNLNIEEVAYTSIKRGFFGGVEFFDAAAELIERFIEENRIDRKKLLGVGITVPGIMNEKSGVIEFAPTLSGEAINIAELKKKIPYPLIVKNDADASGFAEWWSQEEEENFVYIFLERGVGGAIHLKDAVYTGDNGRGGEIGHICVVPDGKLCSCNHRGCLEAYCSTRVISDDQGVTLEEFFGRLRRGDKRSVEVWEKYLRALARGIADVRALLDCRVVIGGAITPYLERYLETLRGYVAEYNFYESEGDFVRLCRHKTKSTCVGVATMFVSKYVAEI